MIILRLMARLPLPALYLLSVFAYALLYHVFRYRRGVVDDNLARAFPQWSKARRQQLARRFYRQLADNGAEIVRARHMPHDEFARRVQVSNVQLLRELSDDCRRPLIIVTIHQGNWEWLSHATSAALGMPLDPVYKPLHQDGVDRFMRELRSRFGARPVPVKAAARHLLRHKNECRLLTLVADQAPIRVERTLWTQFLGQDTAFNPGAETLARLVDCPVVFARCQRLRRGHYQLEFQPLAMPPYAAIPQGDITRDYARLAEAAIRAEPESWLWSNRRWKRQR